MQALLLRAKYSRPLLVVVGFLGVHVLATRLANFTSGPIICPIRVLFGYPCPMCGATRAIGALSRGEFITSLRFNPLGVFITAGIILWSIPSSKISTAVRRGANKFLSKPRAQLASYVLIVYVLLWGFDWLRVITHFYLK